MAYCDSLQNWSSQPFGVTPLMVLRLSLHRKEVSWNPLYCASGAEMVASGARAPSGGVVLPMSSRHTSAWLAGWVMGDPCPAHINTQHPNLHNWCFRHRRHSRICSLSLSLVAKYGDATPPPVAFKNHWWVTIWPHWPIAPTLWFLSSHSSLRTCISLTWCLWLVVCSFSSGIG